MKYKVGDMVRVRPDLKSDMQIRFGTNREMAKLAGQMVTITETDDVEESYFISEDGGEWTWADEMFTDMRPPMSLLDLIDSLR